MAKKFHCIGIPALLCLTCLCVLLPVEVLASQTPYNNSGINNLRNALCWFLASGFFAVSLMSLKEFRRKKISAKIPASHFFTAAALAVLPWLNAALDRSLYWMTGIILSLTGGWLVYKFLGGVTPKPFAYFFTLCSALFIAWPLVFSDYKISHPSCCPASYYDGIGSAIEDAPSCKLCEDSIAVRPPLQPALIASDEVSTIGKRYLVKQLFPAGSDVKNFEDALARAGLKKMPRLCDASTATSLQNISAFGLPVMFEFGMGGSINVPYLAIATHDGQGKILDTSFTRLNWDYAGGDHAALEKTAQEGNPKAQGEFGVGFIDRSVPDYAEGYFWLTLASHHPLYAFHAAPQNRLREATNQLSTIEREKLDRRVTEWETAFAKNHPDGVCATVSRDGLFVPEAIP